MTMHVSHVLPCIIYVLTNNYNHKPNDIFDVLNITASFKFMPSIIIFFFLSSVSTWLTRIYGRCQIQTYAIYLKNIRNIKYSKVTFAAPKLFLLISGRSEPVVHSLSGCKRNVNGNLNRLSYDMSKTLLVQHLAGRSISNECWYIYPGLGF